MPNNTDRRTLRRREAIRTTAVCALVLVAAAIVTFAAQRLFFPEGFLSRLLPYMAMLYILLLPAMAISLRTKLRRIDEQEARKTRPEEEEEPYEDSDH